ncbi:MAG: hypothetical protein GXO45_00860 [Aquificae bacterium]|nr:hypothetical protein [Aquificota bacterium]
MKVEAGTGLSVYKSILDMQKQMAEMIIQQNLQTNQGQETQQAVQQTKNVVNGNAVSTYA